MTSSDLTATQPGSSSTSVSKIAAQPLAWLGFALAGAMLLFAGIATEVYRHDHGADAAELVSFSNPGVLIAFAGIVLLVGGVLAALTAIVFQSAATADDVIARGAALVAVWTIVVAAGAGVITYAATAGMTLGHEGHAVASPTASPSNSAASDEPPGVADRATLRGTLTLDGSPLEAQFLGTRTIRDGLSTACQASIPEVTQGRYEITIAADSEVRGCGQDGAQIVLWAFVNDDYVFSTTTAPWPGDGESVTFDTTFSSASPLGASKPGMGLKGELFDRDGDPLPAGTVVEAFIGDTLCGITSLRYGDATENLYTLYIAGPDSIAGCTSGGTITFRLDGAPARETTTNDPTRPDDGRLTNLTLE